MATGSRDHDPTHTSVNNSAEYQELRRGLEWLIFLRLLVTFFLLSVAIFFEIKESKYFSTHPATPIFGLICIIFVLSLCYVGALGRVKNLKAFSLFQIVTDTVLTTIIIYFTGGVSSAFTLLYVFSILSAGILHLRRAALFIAGVSAVLFGGLATLQFYELLPEYMWPWTSVWRSHDSGYILWVLLIHYAIFFFVALLAGTVAGELKTTKISLTIREYEYERLSDLHTNIIKSIPSGIITTDEHAIVTYVNETGARLLGSTPTSLIGSPLASLFPEILQAERGQKRADRYQIRKKGLLSEPRDFDVSVGELRDRRNQLLGHLVVFSDVTDMRKMEQRAKQSEKQAAFVRIASGMAHEIRNPLASLRGAAELLRETVGDPMSQQHRLLGIVLREADRLNALLSDFILTVNGRQTHTQTVTLDEFLAKILDEFEETACQANAVSVRRNIPPGISIDCQPDRFKQAILNLLSNALDASPKGSIIEVAAQESGEEVLISISDWGHGIPEHMRDRVFEPFFTTKDFGTGLGLPMALSIVEAHGGSLELSDNTPHGVAALVHLPKSRSEKSTGKEDKRG